MGTLAQNSTTSQIAGAQRRSKSPVFVLGCPRSGTTLLYHMLLSAGDFAVYRAESNVFNLLVPRFGDLRSPRNRERLLKQWLRSKLFRVSGLDANEMATKLKAECRSGGDLLRILMEEIARKQGVERWADCTPDHLLYIPEIKRQIPDALIVHIIRDGRDVALSYVKQGWSFPLPWDRCEHYAVASLYWDWIVRKGRKHGRKLGADYQEVFFEDLVNKPREALLRLSEFVGQDLDYERIQRVGIGSVSEPNSSFVTESGIPEFHPVGRWKDRLTPAKLAHIESLVGDLLQELGYPVSDAAREARQSLRVERMRRTYRVMFSAKHWLKNRTPLGRFIDLGRMEIR